jgi:hypothetical protein
MLWHVREPADVIKFRTFDSLISQYVISKTKINLQRILLFLVSSGKDVEDMRIVHNLA